MKNLILIFVFIITPILGCYAKDSSSLKKEIQTITKGKKATVGVAVIFDDKDTVTVNNEYRYPTMSVYKFHQALAVMNFLDKNKSTLEEKVSIKKSDLDKKTHSPLRDDSTSTNFHIKIADLIRYSVSKSDNNACDILFKYIGGPKYVNDYLTNLGIKDFYITATEKQMNLIPENQYLNWTTPLSAVALLNKFMSEDLFKTKEEKIFLEKTLIETTTGADKIKKLLPSNTIVGHKTGSSARNEYGMKIAENDLGFVILPNKKKYTLAVFVMNSLEDDKTNTSIIAEISKAVYDYYTTE